MIAARDAQRYPPPQVEPKVAPPASIRINSGGSSSLLRVTCALIGARMSAAILPDNAWTSAA